MESTLKGITFYSLIVGILLGIIFLVMSLHLRTEYEMKKELITQAEYIHLELKRFNDQIDPDVIRMRATKRRKEQKCID